MHCTKFIGTCIYLRSQVSVYRTIGPLVLIFAAEHRLLGPTINVLSKSVENIKFFMMKFSIFKAEKNLHILHGQVFVMKNTYHGPLHLSRWCSISGRLLPTRVENDCLSVQ